MPAGWIQVPPDLLADLWPAVEPYLAEGLEVFPVATPADVAAKIRDRYADLLVLLDTGQVRAALVMEVYHYPSGSVGCLWLMGGEAGVLEEHTDSMVAAASEWSLARGCSKIAFTGRRGWSKYTAEREGWHGRPAFSAWKELRPCP